MKFIDIGHHRLEYRDIPATRPGQPPLVLLHEGLGCVAMWRDFPDQLAAITGSRVIAGSRAGYGGSTPYAEPRTPRYMHREALEALPAFLAGLGVEHPVLVGHSDGGSIALLFAGAFPDRVRGIVVMAPHEFVEDVTLAGIRAARQIWDTTNLREKLGRYHPAAERVFMDWCETWLSPAFRDWNIMDSLQTIRCPVLAIQGEEDEYATLRQIEVIAEICPDTQLLKLPACGHSPQKDQAERVMAEIAGFVSRLSGS